MNLILLTLLLSSFQTEFLSGHCKTISSNSTSTTVLGRWGRGLENFVEFTDEGDQLAVESSGVVAGTSNGKSETKREILGKGSTAKKNDVIYCPNVQKVLYPVIPVIVASLIGLIGSIIISAIFRLVFKLMRENQDTEWDSSGYDDASGYGYRRRRSGYRLFGYDLSNISYTSLLKNVLTAIDKVY